jgi:hypothetical protein
VGELIGVGCVATRHQHHHDLVITGALERATQLEDGPPAKGAALLKAVDGDGHPSAGDLVQDVLVVHS